MDAVKNDVKRLVKVELAAMARKFERSQRRGWPGSKEQDYGKEE